MNHRIIAVTIFLSSLIAILIGYILLHPDLFGICAKNLASNCLDQSLSFGVGEPLYVGIRFFPILFLVLIFVPKEVFGLWWRVLLPFFIISLLFICTSPVEHSLLTPDRTEVTEKLVWLIMAVSVCVIAYKYWRLRRAGK